MRRHIVFYLQICRLRRAAKVLRALKRAEVGRRPTQILLHPQKGMPALVNQALVARPAVRDIAQVGTERDDAVEHLRDWALRGDEGPSEGVKFGAIGGEELDDLGFQPREPEERRVSTSSL